MSYEVFQADVVESPEVEDGGSMFWMMQRRENCTEQKLLLTPAGPITQRERHSCCAKRIGELFLTLVNGWRVVF